MSVRRAVPAVAAVAIALIGLVIAPPATADQERHGHQKGGFEPVHRLAGSTGGELMRDWWETVLEIPGATNPINFGNPELCFGVGRRGKVATVAAVNPTATCTIKAGQPLFLPTFNLECSSAEPPPFFGATEAEQRACVEAFKTDPNVLAINLSLDGGPAQDIHDDRFWDITPQGEVVFPQGAVFDATPGPATFVGGGWSATPRKRLRPGTHTINIEVVFADETFTNLLTLNVDRRHGHHD
jgi:hypothetical protein